MKRSSSLMDSTVSSVQDACSHDKESLDDLKRKLDRVMVELESARAAAQAQRQLHDTRVEHLENLLDIAQRERDEAREQCFQLQERILGSCLLELPPALSSIQPDQSPIKIFSSPDLKFEEGELLHHFQQELLFTDQQREEDLHYYLQQQHCQEQLDLQEQADKPHMQVLNQQENKLLSQTELCIQVQQHSEENSLPLCTMTKETLQDLDLQLTQPWLSNDKELSVSGMTSVCFSPFQFVSDGSYLGENDFSQLSPPISAIETCSPPVASEVSPFFSSPRLQRGSVVASLLSPLDPFTTLLSKQILHLPEPPEADPQVMLRSLPEKGKLLQAVMQAGPLLQTLLLAGPLPQWRHPPPPLNSMEIPRVPMSSRSLSVPLSHQVPHPIEVQSISENHGQYMTSSSVVHRSLLTSSVQGSLMSIPAASKTVCETSLNHM
ncbi:hypothetical protein O6H91_05G006100 [Diphasiastrum complanatum]|uniref:Uncharacterized protein n=4 Tax=Diphasiastrum complanatum TaxID=34168 RepID=A0ACC2DK80_DIPCM|nr:hypothetical protein O6H91_05G006100 [Diphasiastrum complanatum]KAJ7554714.1 hypothetical protein O6H91_05G006100 [Diphasiastrum complanatum]KAJ7554715.1 hypothetical protein O6H91_05G006100 [Diphasiastrum complanatum]KAJ7554716.1 hypothetical protein O6H91_05G006100 [Diphasiastrum complanatum]